MTSSLVGSEMCIRDSYKEAKVDQPRKRKIVWENFDHEATPPKAIVAVSYTHLTLPTICSV
eukprot:7807941-Prorocentrum_lima.AAC.1